MRGEPSWCNGQHICLRNRGFQVRVLARAQKNATVNSWQAKVNICFILSDDFFVFGGSCSGHLQGSDCSLRGRQCLSVLPYFRSHRQYYKLCPDLSCADCRRINDNYRRALSAGCRSQPPNSGQSKVNNYSRGNRSSNYFPRLGFPEYPLGFHGICRMGGLWKMVGIYR